METQEIVKATTGTTATISYEGAFADNTKKTVTIGSYDTNSLPQEATLKTNIQALNASISGGNADTFASNFVSTSGATCTGINACTITVTNINVLI